MQRTSMEPPLVSICVPVYNREKHLKASLDSILAQTYKNIEIILVDNCSTDNSPQIAKSYGTRLKYFRNEKNLGACGNLNRCVELSGSEYVAIYHSDDVYMPDIIEKQVRLLEANPDVGAVFTEAQIIDGEGKPIGAIRLPPRLWGKSIFTFQDLLVWLVRNRANPLVCPSCMARKSVYQKVGGYNCKNLLWAFDLEMYLRMAKESKIAVIEEQLMKYRSHPGQMSRDYIGEETGRNEYFDIMDAFIASDGGLLSAQDLRRYDCHKDWGCTVQAIKALCRKDAPLANSLLKKSLRMQRLAVGLTDLDILAKVGISAFFLCAYYLGVAGILARMAVDYRMAHSQ
jgi:glycosyltransferase involved in cell wall biosynthesis